MTLIDYLWGVFSEGVVIGLLFWIILAATVTSSSLWVAVRAGLISEAVGNLPYLWGEPGLSPIGLIMALVGAVVFVRMVLKVGEITALQAVYGVVTTYFALVAVVACSPTLQT